MRNTKLFLTLVGLIVLTFTTKAQSISIERILKNPKTYDGESVEVSGIVTQYIATSSNTTAYYLLKGDYGGQIRVNTIDSEPEILKKYKIRGIVYYDRNSRTSFISEKSRVIVVSPTTETASEVELIPETDIKEEDLPIKSISNNNYLLIIVTGGVILLIVLIVVLRKNDPHKTAGISENKGINENQKNNSINSTYTAKHNYDDFKTIKINIDRTNNPKTLKFIPGVLKIISGNDSGKSFKIAGYPTASGNVISIGRKIVKGERSYAHIQLMEKTVSREQAELIEKKGKLFVKNFSQTNFTIVDGVELKADEKIEIAPNSTIKVGEVEFKYIV